MSRQFLVHAVAILVAFTIAPLTAIAKNDEAEIKRKAKAALEKYCVACHGKAILQDGVDVLERTNLIANRKIIPGEPENSRLLKLIKQEKMPPDYADTQPSKEDRSALAADIAAWIAAGAPALTDPPKRKFISNADILDFIHADLKKDVGGHKAKFYRYFTLTHLYNADKSEAELQSYRAGLSKLLNSLSWNATITRPTPIDPAQTILRIELDHYAWKNTTWNAILAQNPYGVSYPNSAVYRECRDITGSPIPYVRGDWFVSAASKPPLYHVILELPDHVKKLEERLLIDRSANIDNGRVARAGFKKSGVSQNNRIIERHISPQYDGGYYWISYDVADEDDRKNFSVHPTDFKHDGGEVIFSLPNGHQAYMLIDAVGTRIEIVENTKIVSDPDQGERKVVNGISCMKCHIDGMRYNTDQIRDIVEKSPQSYAEAERKKVQLIYPPKKVFEDLLVADERRFKAALEKTEEKLTKFKIEPIYVLARQFEFKLDVKTAAAEAGANVDDFLKALDRAPVTFVDLKIPGGTVGRKTYVDGFAGLVAVLHPDGKFVPALVTIEAPQPKETIVPKQAVTDGPQPGKVVEVEIARGVKMKFCWVPPGKATLGSPASEKEREGDDAEHEYTAKGFWLAKYTVTQEEWEAVMGENPSYFSKNGDGKRKVAGIDTRRFPVERVSWTDSQTFLKKLNESVKVSGVLGKGKFCLPHEIEWEYAARGGKGNKQPYYFGNELNGKLANCDGSDPYGTTTKGNFLQRTTAVGSYEILAPHPWGLCDMAGNVLQWCENEHGNKNGTFVVRGGCWTSYSKFCRSAARYGLEPGCRANYDGYGIVGCRVCFRQD